MTRPPSRPIIEIAAPMTSPEGGGFCGHCECQELHINFNLVESNLRPANSLTLGPVGPPVNRTRHGESQDFALLCGGF